MTYHPLMARLRPMAAALALSAGLGPAWGGEAVLNYTVTPHDTLIGLSRTMLVDPASWPEVARLNALPNANLIAPGQVLKLPFRLLRSAQVPATVISVQGQVTVNGRPVQAGDKLPTGQTLQTAEASSAVLQLGDGSRVKLTPLSEAGLDEHRRFDLRANTSANGADEGLFASTMRLVRGGIEVLATKVLRAKPLEVTTPTAVIGVRGTEYRVHLDAAGSGTEVLEGQVRADATSGSGADVPEGFGAAMRPGQSPSLVALAAAPDLGRVPARFERPLVRFRVGGEATPLRVQVAADASFDKLVRDERVAAGSEVRIAGLDDGTWQVRVRRVDDQGVEGYDARREIVLKARPEPPAAMAPRAAGKVPAGAVPMAWAENTEATTYRLQVARDAAFKRLVAEPAALKGNSAEVKLDETGTYFWRLASIKADGDQGPWGDAQSFELRPLPQPPAGGLAADGKSLELNWSGRAQDRQQVQLASDPAFEQMLAQAELTQSRWTVPTPDQPGTAYFRYRSVEPDGFTTPWSSTLKIEIPRSWNFLWMIAPFLLVL